MIRTAKTSKPTRVFRDAIADAGLFKWANLPPVLAKAVAESVEIQFQDPETLRQLAIQILTWGGASSRRRFRIAATVLTVRALLSCSGLPL
jgi:hypothetical protein